MAMHELTQTFIDEGVLGIIAAALGWFLWRLMKIHASERTEWREHYQVERATLREENQTAHDSAQEQITKVTDSLITVSKQYAAVTTRNTDVLEGLKRVLENRP